MAPDVAGEGARGPAPTALPPGPALVVAAHPDDPDIGCGGTMARLVREGQRVVVAVVTDGSEGGEDPSVPDDVLRDRREAEQRAALRELGVDDVEFLRFPDGRLEPSLLLRRALTRLIRRHRPATVFAHDPTAHLFEGYINHPDHRAAGTAALDATFPAAGNPRAFRELLAEGLPAHKVQQVYLFYTANANAWVDISGEPLDRKIAALRHHESQIGTSGEEEHWLREEAANEGRAAGLAAAEGFRRIVIGS
jgi:LmbE family N-acetylglucosaminyl deacetylase